MITSEKTQDEEGLCFIVRYERPDEADHVLVLLEAAEIFSDRNAKYKDNWRRQGWRGPLYDLRRKVERVWDHLWDAEPTPLREGIDPVSLATHDVDDALDIVNYAAILVRAVREGDRDGAWWS
jgi:hypothetical protein